MDNEYVTEHSDWYKVDQGGLLRCCIQALWNHRIEEEPQEEDIFTCKHCDNEMIWTGDYWEWNHE